MDKTQPQTTVFDSTPPAAPHDVQRNASGIWSLADDHIASIEDFEEGPCVVLVRSENVLLLSVELPPIASAAKRRGALPFAIEDRVAEPLDKLHVALGAELAPNVFLVGIVRHDLMRRWVARLELTGLHHAALVPDCLSLPRPAPGHWAVDQAADRACVRAPDGTGFAMPAKLLEQAWTAAGQPDCIAYGDPLPPHMHDADSDLPAGLVLQELPLAERLIAPALDLRQGLYAAPRRPVDPFFKRLATIAVAGLVAHAAIAGANVIALTDEAETREAEVRLLAQNMQPPFPIDADLAVTAATLVPAGPVAPPGQFLPLLTRAGSALAGANDVFQWQSVGYDQAARTLSITVEAADLEALQAASAALEASGLVVTPGAANNGQSAATGGVAGNFIVRAP